MLLVSDANIFMDFAATDLTPLLFRLGDELLVPDILYEEELACRHAHLVALGLQIRSMTGEQIAAAVKLRPKHTGLSNNDLLALTLALGIPCPLITGDRRLRAAGRSEGIEVIGTLTLMERMVERRLVTIDRAELAYSAMKRASRRLPWDEVAAQVADMRGARAEG